MSKYFFTCTMCFCLIYFNLGNVSSCIDMYLGIFVNRIEVEVEVHIMHLFFSFLQTLRIRNSTPCFYGTGNVRRPS